jgi:indolepyruvate ferredoxin oxidoreductase, beta subunit
VAARRLILFDMERLAVGPGSVISASLFGALAGSGALPFPRAAFEEAIRAGGKGVEAALRPLPRLRGGGGGPEPAPAAPPAPAGAPGPRGAPHSCAPGRALLPRRAGPARAPVARDGAPGGWRKVVDFQDLAYGANTWTGWRGAGRMTTPAQGWELTREAAKYIANAMAYDDMIRVADLKTRAPPDAASAAEMGVKDGQLLR